MLTASEAAAAVGGRLVGVDGDTPVGRVVTDSRQVLPGAVFAAIKGERADGHDFAAGARAAGAAFVIAERDLGEVPHLRVDAVVPALGRLARAHLDRLRETGGLTVIGVTGSVGKTTTKDLLARLAAAHGPTVAAAGSFNNDIGLPLTVLGATEETRYLVLEYGANHVGEIAHLTAIAPPDVALELAVQPAHLGEFGSIEAIARTKAELLAALPEGGTAVLNADDPRVIGMPLPAGRGVRRLTFSGTGPADVRATRVETDRLGRVALDLEGPDGQTAHLVSGLIGRHHQGNLLAAVTAGVALGWPLQDSARALRGVTPDSPHRMALFVLDGGGLLLDDSYNANPTSMGAALATLAGLGHSTGRRTLAVIGDMLELGPAAFEAHREAGLRAARLGIDEILAVGEFSAAVQEGARIGGLADIHLMQARDAEAARAALAAGDLSRTITLVKGSNGTGLWRVAAALEAAGHAAGPDEELTRPGDRPTDQPTGR